MVIVIIIIVALLLLVGLIYVLVRNSLVSLNQRVGESWSGIDVQLKRRHDLVPNLVESVKGYATHESETFEKVTQARAAAMQASGPAQASQAESQLTAALGGLRVVAEQYPELRATESIQQWPWSIIAKQGNFTDKEFFEITDAADRETPQVSFS